MAKYYTKLRSLKGELTYLRNIHFHLHKDAEQKKRQMEVDEIFHLLTSLYQKF